MKAIELFLLLLSVCWTSASTRASVMVNPKRSQHFEYDMVTVSCDSTSSGEWTVWRYTTAANKIQSLMPCGSDWGSQTSSTCTIKPFKEHDSGVYWCESKHRDSSNTVNITVKDNQPVILQSPVLPVMEGDDVTLHCKTKTPPSNLPAGFYKDGSLIRTEPTGHMTIHHVNKSDEGLYKCNTGQGESLSSWLLMEGDSDPASLTVDPDLSQLFEYDSLNVICGDNSSVQWKVMRNTTHEDGRFSRCGVRWGTPTHFGCSLQTAKHHDSAVYWCESSSRQRSNSVKISIYDKRPVILQSPVLPVMEGHDVTLHCKTKTPPSNLTAGFYKDGSLIRTEPTGNMTIHHVNKSDEGLYKCDISVHGESPSSWISVTDRDKTAPSTADPILMAHPMMFVLKGVEFFLFGITTIFYVSLCRQMNKGKNPPVSTKTSPLRKYAEELDPQHDDVIADVTEHQF